MQDHGPSAARPLERLPPTKQQPQNYAGLPAGCLARLHLPHRQLQGKGGPVRFVAADALPGVERNWRSSGAAGASRAVVDAADPDAHLGKNNAVRDLGRQADAGGRSLEAAVEQSSSGCRRGWRRTRLDRANG